jgi:hypothetical protein
MSKQQHFRMPLSGFQDTAGSGYMGFGQNLQRGDWFVNKDLQHLCSGY